MNISLSTEDFILVDCVSRFILRLLLRLSFNRCQLKNTMESRAEVLQKHHDSFPIASPWQPVFRFYATGSC